MPIRSVHDRAELAELLGHDPGLHAYELGDLDDFFWPYTSWYRLGDTVALMYHGGGLPVLLALDRPDRADRLADLVEGLLPLLPRRFYAHLSTGAEAVLATQFESVPGGPHLKMALRLGFTPVAEYAEYTFTAIDPSDSAGARVGPP